MPGGEPSTGPRLLDAGGSQKIGEILLEQLEYLLLVDELGAITESEAERLYAVGERLLEPFETNDSDTIKANGRARTA